MLDQLLALSTAVNRLVEVTVKPFLPENLDERLRNGVLLAFSMVFGVIAAGGASLNILADNSAYGEVSSLVGLIVTGLVVGAGSNVIAAVFGILYGWKETLKPTNTPA